jgi:hypothetical protein
MIISRQFQQILIQAAQAFKDGKVSTGDALLQKLRLAISRGGFDLDYQPHQKELMEVMGMIAISIKDAGGFASAVPWFEDVIKLASMAEPNSEDTAWDFAHLTECQLETDDL